MKKILITRKLIKSSEEYAQKVFNTKFNEQDKMLGTESSRAWDTRIRIDFSSPVSYKFVLYSHPDRGCNSLSVPQWIDCQVLEMNESRVVISAP